MADENTLASSSTSHVPNKKTPLDVATILNELTLDEPWTPDETPIDSPAPLQPQRKASATEIFNKRRLSLPLSASHTHSIHADIPSPVVEQSPGFVDISLDAWSDSTPAPQHHSSPAALSISSIRNNPSTSNPFNNSFATSAFPASTLSTRRSSATSPTNPWVGTSPVNKDSIADHSEVLGPFVNVPADSSDGSPSLSVATSPQNGTSHSAQVKRSLSVGNFDSIAESESGTNIRQRATSSNSVFGWLSKSPKVARPSKTRPTTLPPKDPKEEEKHLREYHQLQQAAQMLQKKREARHREEREARESYMHNSVNLWETEIIPFWMAQSSFPFMSSSASPARLKNSKHFSISGRTRNLWHQGLPPKCRGTVWCLGIGNEVGVTKEMFDLCVIKARKISILNGKRESDGSIDSARGGDGGTLNQGYLDMTQQISMDISRTFPSLKLFQPGAPYYAKLTELLETYICWGHDLGYSLLIKTNFAKNRTIYEIAKVEGMSFIAAILLINMEAMPAFVCFVNLLRRPLHLAFFRMDMDQMDGYFQVFKELFVQQLPMLYVHFQKIGIQPDLYIYDWFLTVFSQTLSLELATKMWDLFLCDGSSFLFRAGVALLASVEARLYGDFDEVLYTLSHITTVDPPVTEVLLMRNLNDIKLDEKEFLELCTRHQCLP